MATILDKDLIRESTVMVGDRLIVVTLGEDQSISMKLKGMKTGAVSITIENLYKQLIGDSVEEAPKLKTISASSGSKKGSTENMISLHDIRHRLNISNFDYATTVKLDGILKELLEE